PAHRARDVRGLSLRVRDGPRVLSGGSVSRRGRRVDDRHHDPGCDPGPELSPGLRDLYQRRALPHPAAHRGIPVPGTRPTVRERCQMSAMIGPSRRWLRAGLAGYTWIVVLFIYLPPVYLLLLSFNPGLLPSVLIVLLTSFSVLRGSLAEAAQDLGASELRVFWDITFPLIRPGIISGASFALLLSFNEFIRAFFLVGGQDTLPIYMFGAMNAGTSPTIYSLAGSTLLLSALGFGLALVGLTLLKTRRGWAHRAVQSS